MYTEWCDIETLQWVNIETAQWIPVIPFDGLYQIWTDDKYVYAATSSGLAVIDIETEQLQSFATNPNGYTTVWSDNVEVFVGTTVSGIKTMNQSDVGPTEIITFLEDYAKIPDLTSDVVEYVYGNLNKLIICTSEGVDIIRRDSGYRTYTTLEGAKKCFVTPDYDYFYYMVSGTESSSINKLNNNTSNWSVADTTYTTGSGFLITATNLTDFFVTEHTSTSGSYNTLFVATDKGVYVYDEGTGQYDLYTSATLAGSSTNFTSVWASPEANIQTGRMYTGTTGSGSAFSVVDLENEIVIDSYLIDKVGEYDEDLDREDIKDINVSTLGA